MSKRDLPWVSLGRRTQKRLRRRDLAIGSTSLQIQKKALATGVVLHHDFLATTPIRTEEPQQITQTAPDFFSAAAADKPKSSPGTEAESGVR